MDEEKRRMGREIGEQLDALDRAVRRNRLRWRAAEGLFVAALVGLLFGIVGLVLGGVAGMVKSAGIGFVCGCFPVLIILGYHVFTYKDEPWF